MERKGKQLGENRRNRRGAGSKQGEYRRKEPQEKRAQREERGEEKIRRIEDGRRGRQIRVRSRGGGGLLAGR